MIGLIAFLRRLPNKIFDAMRRWGEQLAIDAEIRANGTRKQKSELQAKDKKNFRRGLMADALLALLVWWL